jgi:hypothetical protein
MWQSKCSTVQFWESAHPAGFSEMKPVTANSRLLDEHADFSSAAAELYAVANCVNDVIALSYVCEDVALAPWRWKSIFIDQGSLNGNRPSHPQMPTRPDLPTI